MGFKISFGGGKNTPAVYCDHCKEGIKDLKKANVLWDPDYYKTEPYTVEIVHMGCSNAYEKKVGRRHWMRLSQYMSWLLWNTGYGKRKIKSGEADEDSIIVPVPRPIEFA